MLAKNCVSPYNKLSWRRSIFCQMTIFKEGRRKKLDKVLIDEILRDIGLEHIDEDESDQQ